MKFVLKRHPIPEGGTKYLEICYLALRGSLYITHILLKKDAFDFFRLDFSAPSINLRSVDPVTHFQP